MRGATPHADAGKLVTFRYRAGSPETGYGYIRRGDAVPGATDAVAFAAQFVEKPGLETAQAYVASGDYY